MEPLVLSQYLPQSYKGIQAGEGEEVIRKVAVFPKSLEKVEEVQNLRPIQIGGYLGFQWPKWKERGADVWVVEVLKEGYRIPFLVKPPLSAYLVPFNTYGPSSMKG